MALRLGLLGYGRWGRNIHRTLLTFPDVEVTIIARGERAPAQLDGVLIATQSSSHAENALPYIAAGIPTFIEKPMATTLRDAQRIREAADRGGAIVFVGHIFLYHPAFLAALKLLPSLGAIRYLLCEGMNNSPRADTSVLWDWLPHDLAMANAILGREPDSVVSWNLSAETVPAAALAKFNFSDTPVVCTVSWCSSLRRRRLTVTGADGTLVFDDTAAPKLALYDKRGELTHPLHSDALPLTREMDAFLQAVRTGTADAPHVQLGIGIVRAIAAAEDSIARGSVPVAVG
jgi:predicted dehydrogenase